MSNASSVWSTLLIASPRSLFCKRHVIALRKDLSKMTMLILNIPLYSTRLGGQRDEFVVHILNINYIGHTIYNLHMACPILLGSPSLYQIKSCTVRIFTHYDTRDIFSLSPFFIVNSYTEDEIQVVVDIKV